MTVALLFLSFAPSAAEARAEFSTTQLPWPVIGFSTLSHTFAEPTYVTHAGDNSNRIFIVEQGGRIHIWQDGEVLTPPFLDFGEPNGPNNPVDNDGENGLLSVAFPPDFATSGYFFVYYNSEDDRIGPPDESDVVGRTREGNGGSDSVIARFRVHADDPNRADMTSETPILLVNQPYSNHNGGLITFGPDGYLYIGLGDGGLGGDPIEAGQRLDTLLGKILRIDVSNYDAAEPYTIPDDNPFNNGFAAVQNVRAEIWAYGLRNPWRFSFDRTTDDLYIGDVGQGEWEEINFQPAASTGGENYGWDIAEGPDCYYDENDNPDELCNRAGITDPIFAYTHASNDALCASVTGGYVYRGPNASVLQGTYLFGDYCSGRIWGIRRIANEWRSRELLDTDLWLTSFGEDQAGNLYVTDRATGLVHRLLEFSQQKFLPIISR